MKLEVGMYVRTKRDGIGKIISLSVGEEDECCFIELSNRRTGTKEHNIIKASYNIIDLIEEGDIIEWEIIEPYYRDDGINEVISRFDEGLGIYQIEADRLLPLKDMTIKFLITKEQFEAMKYEVK